MICRKIDKIVYFIIFIIICKQDLRVNWIKNFAIIHLKRGFNLAIYNSVLYLPCRLEQYRLVMAILDFQT